LNNQNYLQKVIQFCSNFPFDMFEGVVITDHRGIILYVDEKHPAFYGRKREDEIGKDIKILNQCTVFPRVIDTGKPIIGKRLIVHGKEFVGSVIPLKRNNTVIGAMGITLFSNIDSLKGLLDISCFSYPPATQDAPHEVRIGFQDIIGVSEIMKSTKELAYKASQIDLSILLTGETGTGKMMFAKAIHNASPRRNYPFVPINCATIPKDLFETEFFGYAPGAFSGSHPKGKPGKFEIAHHGTIFLDEIGNLPLEFQVKLLDVLQEKQLVRVGGVEPLNVDFRLITATSEDLERMVQEGTFRSDLYFRINVAEIHLPPLRERQGDIPVLIQYKLKEMREKYKLDEEIYMDKDLIKYLTEYSFPGNVRELFNLLERTSLHLKGNKITKEDLSPLKPEASAQTRPAPLKTIVDQAEREAITQTLKLTRGDVSDAARILEVHRTTLYKKIEKYRIRSDVQFPCAL
jgi:transcriptional regulator with PAS, ATPase and Fis domain